MADNQSFYFQVISPERIFFQGDVNMIEMNTSEGEIGVLPGHIPLTSIVVPGILRIMQDGEIKEAAVHEGFVEILQDKVTLLVESCEWPEEIDVHRAEEAKIRAERRMKSGDQEINLGRAEIALRKSLLRLEIAEKYSK